MRVNVGTSVMTLSYTITLLRGLSNANVKEILLLLRLFCYNMYIAQVAVASQLKAHRF